MPLVRPRCHPDDRPDLTEEYHARFLAEDWPPLREACFARQEHICAACHNTMEEPRGHHITYVRFWHEWPDDLLGVCAGGCHDAADALRRAARDHLLYDGHPSGIEALDRRTARARRSYRRGYIPDGRYAALCWNWTVEELPAYYAWGREVGLWR